MQYSACVLFCIAGTHSTIIYKNANDKIEQITGFFGYALTVTNIILLLPALLYTVVNYYFLDSGKESFFLFFPTWFVLYNEIFKLKMKLKHSFVR